MLDAIVGIVAALLIAAGSLVMIGPRNLMRRIATLTTVPRVPAAFEPSLARDAVVPAINPQTQRVLTAASRLASWLRAHSNEEAAREIRGAAARRAGTR